MKIALLDADSVNTGGLSWGPLEAVSELKVYGTTKKDEIVSHAEQFDGIIVNKTLITREIMSQLPQLKYIGIFATGYNNIDLEGAKEFGITVCNVPGYSTYAVAQFTFALLLELCHHVQENAVRVKEGAWSNTVNFNILPYPLVELKDKSMGIIGFGDIGQHVGRIANAFGMNVVFYNPRPKNGQGFATQVSLEELLAVSDVVSVHCPLFESNAKMINKQTIAQMKDGAFFLNTARGGLVDEEDLAQALESGKLAGAGLDVVSREPIREDNPLLHVKNCIITPHLGWAPAETRQRLIGLAAQNVEAFLKGKPINQVTG